MTRPLVINLGLPRTGTSSLREAMRMLGWTVQTDPFQARRRDLLFSGRPWGERQANVAKAIELDRAEGFDFLSEPYWVVAPLVAHGLVDLAALGAIVILTVRDRDEWRRSIERKLAQTARPRAGFAGVREGIWSASQALECGLSGGPAPTPDQVERAYDESVALVGRPGVELLAVCGGEGWSELARILGDLWLRVDNLYRRSGPTVPFPHENRS